MTMLAWPRYPGTGLGWPDAMAPADAGGREESRLSGGPLLESGLGFRLGRAHRLLRAAWEEEIADLGLSPPQAALLRAVAQRPGRELGEVARLIRAGVREAQLLADHLQWAGLVSLVPGPAQQQRRLLRPTPRGSVLAGELARRAEVHQRRLGRLIGSAEITQLLGLLARVESALSSAAQAKAGED